MRKREVNKYFKVMRWLSMLGRGREIIESNELKDAHLAFGCNDVVLFSIATKRVVRFNSSYLFLS